MSEPVESPKPKAEIRGVVRETTVTVELSGSSGPSYVAKLEKKKD